MKLNRKLLRAFLLAPIAAPVAYAAVLVCRMFGAALGSSSVPSASSVFDVLRSVAFAGVPIAYGATLFAGAPIYFVLRSKGVVRRSTLWVAGALIGAVVALLMAPALKGDLFSIRFPWWAGAALGAISAEAFWWLLGVSDNR